MNPLSSLCALALVACLPLAALAQTPARDRAAAQVAPALRPQEIARRCLPSVVLIVCDAGGDESSQGSGFFVRPGIVATNYHVIEDAVRGNVQMVGQGEVSARVIEVIAYDKDEDLALLRVERTMTATALPLAEGTVETGEAIYALGNPEGLAGSLSNGLVSNAARPDGNRTLIQISAPLSHGSSGGPVVNERGEVVGVAVGSLTEGQNLNFAIPVARVRALLRRMAPSTTLVAASKLRGAWRAPAGLVKRTSAATEAEDAQDGDDESVIGERRENETDSVASLRGLRGVLVAVEEPDEDLAAYVSKPQLERLVEQKLRQHKIRSLTETEFRATPGAPILSLSIELLPVESTSLSAYGIYLQLEQTVTPDRDPSCPAYIWGATWHKWSIGYVGGGGAREELSRGVDKILEQFATDFASAQ